MTAPHDDGAGVGRAWALIVCGGRDYPNGVRIYDTLDRIVDRRGYPSVLRHGSARGADMWGESWAKCRGVPTIRYPADWRQYGPAAGPIRNAAMLAAGADLVVAFPGGKGTADMVAKARAAGVEVIEVPA